MSLKQIEEEIRAKGEAELQELHRSKKGYLKAIHDETKEEIRELVEKEAARAEREVMEAELELGSAAEMEAKRILLIAREEALRHEMKRVRVALVRALSGGEAARALIKMGAARARELAASGMEAVALVCKRDAALAGELLPKGIGIKTGDSKGITISSADGRVAILLTPESVAEAMEESARAEVASRLFPRGIEFAGREARRDGGAGRAARPKRKKVPKRGRGR